MRQLCLDCSTRVSAAQVNRRTQLVVSWTAVTVQSMAPKFQKVLAVLNNNASPPKHNSLSHYGRLSKNEVHDLATALRSSSFAGRIQLKCGVHLDWSLSSVNICSLLTNRHRVLRVLAGRLRRGADSGCTEREQNSLLPEAAGYGLYWPASKPSPACNCFRNQRVDSAP